MRDEGVQVDSLALAAAHNLKIVLILGLFFLYLIQVVNSALFLFLLSHFSLSSIVHPASACDSFRSLILHSALPTPPYSLYWHITPIRPSSA